MATANQATAKQIRNPSLGPTGTGQDINLYIHQDEKC